MSFINKWEIKVETAERKKSDRIQNEQKEKILSALAGAGISTEEVKTDGYRFQFPYRGMWVSFVNQTNRLVVTIHRPPKDEEEKELLKDAHVFANGKYGQEFCEEFLYAWFILNDNSASGVQKVLKIAEQQSLLLK